ncbi:MAG: FtsX-like permease family protein [Flavobacteriales bacterium]|nr:FtsX-like permease family protein [Flavobacteriales bacterium]
MALSAFSQTFILTQAIAAVLLFIASFGLFLSANNLELARINDLIILNSLGYSPMELFIHMFSQWMLLACGAILMSWPVAAILADTLVTEILSTSFGWAMPLMLDVGSFANGSLIGLLLLTPALCLPLLKLNIRGRG